MEIQLENIGKRFRYEWIFRNMDITLEDNLTYAITGPNGSGKSTLLRVLAGQLTPSEGNIVHRNGSKTYSPDTVYQEVGYAAPYMELIEEFTLTEALAFHSRFKKWRNDLTSPEVLSLMELSKSAHKPIRYFSSGMKQRLKLALACCSDTQLLILDEPNTNLDANGMTWYRNLVEANSANRIVVIASNLESDFPENARKINLPDFKPAPKK